MSEPRLGEHVTGNGRDSESIARSLAHLRRRQRRSALAGSRPISDIYTAEVVDAVANATDIPLVGDIARALTLDPSQASRRVKASVDAGLVVRTSVQGDGRMSGLRLSPAGTRLAEDLDRTRGDLIATATQSWTASDRRHLADLLERLVDDLDSAGTNPS